MSEPLSVTDWQKLGTITTSNGMLALVAPYYANTLGRWWNDVFLAENEARRRGELPRTRPSFQGVKLEQVTTSVTNPDGYRDTETAVLVDCDNGGYAVEARFCDLYGDGHMSICDLRIRLHYHDGDEADEAVTDGRACALCGEEDGPMVPVHQGLFVHDACRARWGEEHSEP